MGLSNFDIQKIAKHLEIPNFKGVFTRDQLPKKIGNKEAGIVNLNTSNEPGSHWVAYFRDGSKKIYFDSFGQVIPKFHCGRAKFQCGGQKFILGSFIVGEQNFNVGEKNLC